MMGKGIRYTDEFKQEAVNQVVVHGYPVSEVSERLGMSTKSLYVWIKRFSNSLSSGERIEIRGLGSFNLHYHPSRSGRNP